MVWYRTKEYDEARYKQLNPVAKSLVSLGNTITGGRASKAGEEFRQKNPKAADIIYFTPTGQMYAGTAAQNEKAAENVIKDGGNLYTTEPKTAGDYKEITNATLPVLDWNFPFIDEKLETGIKGVGVGVGITLLVVIAAVFYLIFKKGLGVDLGT